MARFFMTGTNIFGGRAVIRGQDAEHIRVLRMRPGEDVVICDGKGTDYRCRLVSSGPEEAEAEVLEVVPCRGEPRVEVTVYAGLPKGERADFLVQKCIEAGASGIVFMLIVMASLSGLRRGELPLTLLLVLVLYLGGEVVDALTVQDSVSHLTHIVGGLCGAALGFSMSRQTW